MLTFMHSVDRNQKRVLTLITGGYMVKMCELLKHLGKQFGKPILGELIP